jgi:Transmembrane domain of unknown function (DUF3566)
MSIFSKTVRRADAGSAKTVNLKLTRINFWSAIRMGFVVTIALGIGTILAFLILWVVLSAVGVTNALSSQVGIQLNLASVLSAGLTLAVFNIVLGTLLAGVYAAIFNLVARITGGLSVGFTNN